ncbi:hypothetical protein OAA96_03700 [Polaribacter sp.]|nr:hypothetical protein [Polaribacter sp.]
MKKVLLIVLFMTALFQGFSQTRGISYQAVILSPTVQEIPGADAQGNILANSTVSIQFTIVDKTSNAEFQEYHTTSTDRYGMINLLIGNGAATYNSFNDIVWDGTNKKLKVGIDFTGGSNFSSLSEQNLTYMPQPVTQETTQLINDNFAAVQADVDANETASDAADLTLTTNLATATQETTQLINDNFAAVQADLDANETASDAADLTLTTKLATEVLRATTAEGLNAADIVAVQADVDQNESDADIAIAAVQVELDNTQAGSGLLLDGSYQANTSANYINSSTSLVSATEDLDTAIAALVASNQEMSNMINDMQQAIEGLETQVQGLVSTGQYYPTAQEGSGSFNSAHFIKVGSTIFVFGNFSAANGDSTLIIDSPNNFIFSSTTDVSGVISGVMGFGESVGGYVEAVPGTNNVKLIVAGAHMMAFDTTGSFVFSFKENEVANSYTPLVVSGNINPSQANYEIVGSTVLVNGNFLNGDFDGFGMTAEISVPTSTIFSSTTDVSGVISGIGFDESVGGYVEAVPGTNNVKLIVAGAHMMAFDTMGSFVFSYNTNNNALSYTPTNSGLGTLDSVNYFTYGEMIIVNGKFSGLEDSTTISIPRPRYFTSSNEVSGIITATDYESFGGYIESVPNSNLVKFVLRGAHNQSRGEDGSFYFIYKL